MLLQSCFRIGLNMLLMGVVYLIIDKYNYFIIPKRKSNYLLLLAA